MAKFSELWVEVEDLLAHDGMAGKRLAVLEAYKILEAVLEAKGYPGKTIEDKLYWAGFSGKDKEGIAEAIERRNNLSKNLGNESTDFELQDAVRLYKKVAQEIVAKPKLTIPDKLKAYFEMYFSLSSIRLWRNLSIVLGTFLAIKLLAQTAPGQTVVDFSVNVANFVISWIFVVIVLVLIAIFFGVGYYLENRQKIKIK